MRDERTIGGKGIGDVVVFGLAIALGLPHRGDRNRLPLRHVVIGSLEPLGRAIDRGREGEGPGAVQADIAAGPRPIAGQRQRAAFIGKGGGGRRPGATGVDRGIFPFRAAGIDLDRCDARARILRGSRRRQPDRGRTGHPLPLHRPSPYPVHDPARDRRSFV